MSGGTVLLWFIPTFGSLSLSTSSSVMVPDSTASYGPLYIVYGTKVQLMPQQSTSLFCLFSPPLQYSKYFMTHFALLLSDLMARCASVLKLANLFSFWSQHPTLVLLYYPHNTISIPVQMLGPIPFLPWSIIVGFLSVLFAFFPHYLSPLSIHPALWPWVKSLI